MENCPNSFDRDCELSQFFRPLPRPIVFVNRSILNLVLNRCEYAQNFVFPPTCTCSFSRYCEMY